MCFATAAAIAAVAGAGVSAYGSVQGGYAAKDAATYQAAVAKNNAIIAEQNAKHAEAAGAAQAEAISLKGRAVGGQIKAAQAASGIDVNSGSALDVQEGSREQSSLDTMTTMDNALLQAYGYRTQATGFEAQSELDKASGSQAVTAGYLKAGGGLLSTAGSVASKWGAQQAAPAQPADWTGDSGHAGWIDNRA